MNETLKTDAISWSQIFKSAKSYKRSLLQANIIAIFAAILSAPVPMLMPLLVDEVLLNKPGFLIEGMQAIFPESLAIPAFILLP